tara:strand:+ start:6720 stop:7706 length:987 start_codon:yes stop_codon:yes gene_type:complete
LNKTILILILIFIKIPECLCQKNDSLSYQLFKDRLVFYSDIGINSAPFNLKDNFNLGIEKIKYRNNIKPTLGFGFNYQWLAIRIGFNLPVNILNKEKYGDTKYFNINIKSNVNNFFFTVDFKNYRGYSIIDAYKFNNDIENNLIMPSNNAMSISTNLWYLKNKTFKMRAFEGKSGHFNSESKTMYLKGTLNYFNIHNNSQNIIPTELADSIDYKNAEEIGALDFGIIPGFAYGNRIKNWQFGLFLGLGGVIQTKYYTKNNSTRSYIGIAPRFDFKFCGGYSKSNYFILLVSDFDIRSVRINNLNYNHTFYNVRITGGFRLKTKKKDYQ